MTGQRVWEGSLPWNLPSFRCLKTCQLTRHSIVELILAEGTPPWGSLDDGLLKLVVLCGKSLQRFGEDLILLHLVLQFQTAHLSSPHTHKHTHPVTYYTLQHVFDLPLCKVFMDTKFLDAVGLEIQKITKHPVDWLILPTALKDPQRERKRWSWKGWDMFIRNGGQLPCCRLLKWPAREHDSCGGEGIKWTGNGLTYKQSIHQDSIIKSINQQIMLIFQCKN